MLPHQNPSRILAGRQIKVKMPGHRLKALWSGLSSFVHFLVHSCCIKIRYVCCSCMSHVFSPSCLLYPRDTYLLIFLPQFFQTFSPISYAIFSLKEVTLLLYQITLSPLILHSKVLLCTSSHSTCHFVFSSMVESTWYKLLADRIPV